MREYVEKMLHTRVELEPGAISGLPLYLRGLYSLERWTVFGVPLAPPPLESQTAKTMAKHHDALEAALGVPWRSPSRTPRATESDGCSRPASPSSSKAGRYTFRFWESR